MSEFIDTVVRVRYAETDKMGIVYYANYFIYFEIGRVEYLRQRGLDYRRMELEDDSFTVVAEAKCRYRRPARYDDPLRIRTRVTLGQAPHDYLRLRNSSRRNRRAAGHRRNDPRRLRQQRPPQAAAGKVSPLFRF